MKTILSVSFSKACSRHSGHRGQTVFAVRTGNPKSLRQFAGSIPNGDNQANYNEVRAEALLPNQHMELSHWSAMFDNNSPVLIKGMRRQRLFNL
jgi:hypothetical protein